MWIMKKWPKCSKDFWQALSEFYFDNGDLEKNDVVHPRVFDGADFIGHNYNFIFYICDVIIHNFPYFHQI